MSYDHPDGSERRVEVTEHPMYTADGQLTDHLLGLVDVTERRWEREQIEDLELRPPSADERLRAGLPIDGGDDLFSPQPADEIKEDFNNEEL